MEDHPFCFVGLGLELGFGFWIFISSFLSLSLFSLSFGFWSFGLGFCSCLELKLGGGFGDSFSSSPSRFLRQVGDRLVAFNTMYLICRFFLLDTYILGLMCFIRFVSFDLRIGDS